ncbi:MAG TPA: hypothetical protein VM925_27315 [Labilithrix sp.]|nr:hypothetical protein [Labilithrix sp.]
MARRWFVLLAFGVVLAHGAAACMEGDTELNPQPLPPRDSRDSKNGGSSDTEKAAGQEEDNSASPTAPAADGAAPSSDASADGSDAGGDT